MEVLWYLFWSGFSVFYLANIFIANNVFYDDGSGVSGTHIWVYEGSNTKVRDATARDVWNRQNPGKSWDEQAKRGAVSWSIFFTVLLLVLLLWLAYRNVYSLPGDWLSALMQVGTLLLGMAMAGLNIYLQSRIVQYRSESDKNFNALILVLLAICLVVVLVLTLFRVNFPIMQFWPLVFLGTWFRNFLSGGLTEKDLDRIAEHEAAVRKKQSAESDGKLMSWATTVMGFMNEYDPRALKNHMNNAVVKLQRGEFDLEINQYYFFKETESIILDFINGNVPRTEFTELHGAQDQVLMTAQMFYLYIVTKHPEYEIHPKIQAVLQK